MKSGIIYLLTGPTHAARLVVSLWSLRKYYDGPVTVFTTRPESHEIGSYCEQDSRLHVRHVRALEAKVRRNSAFLTKLDLLVSPPYETTVYLDADTLVAGKLDELTNVETDVQFHATRFANWVSSGKIMAKRISRWRTIRQKRFDPQWLADLVDDALKERPAVNGGVFAIRHGAEILTPWRDLAYAGWKTFICDEVALQLLLHRYPHRLLDCRYNCSPRHAGNLPDTRIWHFHGEKHLAAGLARSIWLPEYEECMRLDVGRISKWTPAGDPALKSVPEKLAS